MACNQTSAAIDLCNNKTDNYVSKRVTFFYSLNKHRTTVTGCDNLTVAVNQYLASHVSESRHINSAVDGFDRAHQYRRAPCSGTNLEYLGSRNLCIAEVEFQKKKST